MGRLLLIGRTCIQIKDVALGIVVIVLCSFVVGFLAAMSHRFGH